MFDGCGGAELACGQANYWVPNHAQVQLALAAGQEVVVALDGGGTFDIALIP